MIKLKQSQVKAYRDEMLMEQDGKCAYCGQDCKKPCLDHAHMEPYKDKIRGVICNWCNIAIGKLENARVRTGTSWEDFDNAFTDAHDYIHYAPGPHADWHPSKRKSEVTEFRKMNAAHQVNQLILKGISLGLDLADPKYNCKNATDRIKLFRKLNNKT